MAPGLSIHQLLKRTAEHSLDAGVASRLATAYSSIGANRDALSWIDKAIELAPLATGDYFYAKGKILSELDAFTEAGECYQRAIELGTRMPHPSALLAAIYARKLGRHAEAISLLTRDVRSTPADIFPYVILTECFEGHGAAEIIESAKQILAGAYDRFALHCGVAEALCRRGRFEEAAHCADYVLREDPNCSYAWFVRGSIALRGFHDPDAALHCHSQAAALDRRWIEAVIGDLLYLADYESAREKFLSIRPQYRLLLAHPGSAMTAASSDPVLDGQVVLARSTMGFGDAILHSRFASRVHKAGAEVIIQCANPICSLLETSPGVARVIPHEGECPFVSFDMNLEHLGFLCRLTVKEVGHDIPYLLPSKELRERWHSRLPPSNGLRVGIAWRGGPSWQDEIYRSRSVRLSSFTPLFGIPGITWISLQKGPGTEELRTHGDFYPVQEIGLEKDFADFADTAAAISMLDLVITVDTSIAHLAGAMGKPTFVLLPYTAFWVWSLKGQRTPWYPAVKLFRQRRPGEWAPPISQIKGDLEALVAKDLSLSDLTVLQASSFQAC